MMLLRPQKKDQNKNSVGKLQANKVDFPPPSSSYVKQDKFPASNIGTVEIPFRGKVLKVGGDRVVDPWTVTVINDENNAIRSVMEVWMQQINSYDTAEGTSAASIIYLLMLIFSNLTEPEKHPKKRNLQYIIFMIFGLLIYLKLLSYDSTDAVEEFRTAQVHRWEEAKYESGVYDKLN